MAVPRCIKVYVNLNADLKLSHYAKVYASEPCMPLFTPARADVRPRRSFAPFLVSPIFFPSVSVFAVSAPAAARAEEAFGEGLWREGGRESEGGVQTDTERRSGEVL